MTNIKKQVNETIAEQKAKYESEKDQERKRRFAILSGNIKPIKTSFHLNEKEHAYFEFRSSRMADRDYIESHTKGTGIGEGFGRMGVGIARSTTTQERVTKLETVDTGSLLFTNKRILFVGKEVVSVTYHDILSTEFNGKSMIIKYPSMIKNECYDIEKTPDAELYFKGIMRLLGKEKNKINEDDVDMHDYPEFISSEVKETKKKQALLTKMFIWIGLPLFAAILLKDIILPIIVIAFFVLIVSGIAYPIIHIMNIWGKNKYKKEVVLLKRSFLWLLPFLFFSFIVYGVVSSSTTNKAVSKPKAVTVKTNLKISKVTVKPTKEAAQVAAYKAEIKPIIQQFEAEDAIIEADKSKQDYRTDPIYIHAAKVYSDINQELLNAKVNPPNSYGGYSTFLAWITGDMSDAMDNIVGNDGSSHVSGFSLLEVGTCEADIKIAAKMNPTYQGSGADITYNGYGGKITDLENIATGKL